MIRFWCARCVFAVRLVALAVTTPPAVAQQVASVWDGVFAAGQAERGKDVYNARCVRCHGDDLANSRNPLAGDRFAERWESRTLADLFHRIRDTMPPGEAASVENRAKVDALAYLMRQNGFPEGPTELTDDDDRLAAIQITRKTGPGPLRTGAVVRADGCLDHPNEREWRLTNATEPTRTTLDPPSRNERRDAPGEAGARTIVLMNPYPTPGAHLGHRMMATGFLLRNTDGDAINVVSLEMIAPACSP